MSDNFYIDSWSDNDLDDGELPRLFDNQAGKFEFCFDHWYRVRFEDGSIGWWPDGDSILESIFRDVEDRSDIESVTIVSVA